MRTKKNEGAKAELVAFVRQTAADKSESAANGQRAWRHYNRGEARELRWLAQELRALPDDDERLRELDVRLKGPELYWQDFLREQVLDVPGAHPDADPGDALPGVDELLGRLLKHVRDWQDGDVA